ncbi:MAG: Abi-alpha family protein, partial [Marmoricola sp.]
PVALFEASVTITSSLAPDEQDAREEGEKSLRERGEDLLRRSRDVWSDDQAHPAYARILDEVAPDEARILLLLLRGGPQPSVDVRTGGPVGMVSSSLLSAGLTMIGPRAGVRYLDEVPAYLNNLYRLGLVWFSREQLEDPLEYQVVEAQPDVLEAMHSVRFAKVVRRSIHLTPFGLDFCKTCLVDDEETTNLPVHEAPEE